MIKKKPLFPVRTEQEPNNNNNNKSGGVLADDGGNATTTVPIKAPKKKASLSYSQWRSMSSKQRKLFKKK
eukprot:CAMPEP_0185775366 /NCGR_PEP_ID=MMETSP1174-20130828/81789_1 /TAXON_ID=35687 /ORGANISM="Dictyocha speculum, Strain CCMP1381" /LENGTH=69 /DNA_ID=CAMNT_0028462911 /DNA_START=173 /DNA_END=382 /DNA_ORIENTATION=-